MEQDTPRRKKPAEDDEAVSLSRDDEDTAAVLLLADVILAKAIKQDVGEIYIQPGVTDLEVHFVKDGRRSVDRCLPRRLGLLIARYKQMAGMDLHRYTDQKGEAVVRLRGKEYKLYIDSHTAEFGEVIHIICFPTS